MIDQLKEARSLMEQTEKSNSPEIKVVKMNKALDIIESYEEDYPELAKEQASIIENIKKAHLRRLLTDILNYRIDLNIWIDLLVLIFIRLEKEFSNIRMEDPIISKNASNLMELWKSEFEFYVKVHKLNRSR